MNADGDGDDGGAVSGSRSMTRARSTATSGVIELRKAALAGVVVLTAYTKAIDARSSPAQASSIVGPERKAAHVAPGRRRTMVTASMTSDDGNGSPDQVLERVGIVGQPGEHGAEAPDDAGSEGGGRGEEWHTTTRNRGMDAISAG